MLRAHRAFWITCACIFIALVLADSVYLHQHPADRWLISAALPAFLLEGFFYLAATFQSTRTWFSRLPSRYAQATVLWISAALPYLIFSISAGTFQLRGFFLLVVLTAVLSFWQVALPHRLVYDTGFLVIAAAPIVARVFPRLYVSPDPSLHVDILGHLMWLRLGIAAVLVLRQWDPGSFGLWPRLREWKAGLLWYAVAMLPLTLLAIALRDARIAPLQKEPIEIAGIAIGTFFGILWVVALGEELLFRGVLARGMLKAGSSRWLAVLISSVLFGCAHLWFHAFPNWRRALVATLLGVFCGTAYVRTQSVRVPMVTHALVVTTWRVFFK